MSVSIEQKSPQYEDWQSLDYEYLLRLKQSHPTLKLLAADNGPLIISFLYYNSSRSTGAPWRNPIWSPGLDDYLYQLRQIHGEALYSKSAQRYLDDWSARAHSPCANITRRRATSRCSI